MARKREKPGEIVNLFRQADVLLREGILMFGDQM